MTRITLRRVVVGAACFLAPLPAVAQQAPQPAPKLTVAAQWLPFLGCWAPANAADRTKAPLLCLASTPSIATVEMLTVINDSIVSRQLIDGSGQRTDFKRDGCTGVEAGTWSLNERAFYSRSEFTCDGGEQFTSSAVLAMTSANTFSRVEGVRTRSNTKASPNTGVRIASFVSVGDTITIPAEIRMRIPAASAVRVWAARVDSRTPLEIADVVHAIEYVDAPVVQAWIAETGQRFELNARGLRELQRGSVPGPVIDMMVAVSNPQAFALAAGGQPVARGGDDLLSGRSGGGGGMLTDAEVDALLRQRLSQNSLFYDPFWMGAYGMGGSLMGPYRRGQWDPYWNSYSPFGNGYGFGAFNSYNPYNFGYGYGGSWLPGNQPILIIPQPSGGAGGSAGRQPGRVINGQGYVQGGSASPSEGGTAMPRPRVESSGGGYYGGSGGSSSSGSASVGGGSSGSSAPASSGGGERTAKPRPDPR